MFDESQDAETPCSIKPLAQTDPSHANTNLPRLQDPLPEYSVGAGNDEDFVITATATRQSGVVAKQWLYGC